MTRVLLVALLTSALANLVSGCAFGGSQQPDGLLTRSPEGNGAEMAAIVGGTLR